MWQCFGVTVFSWDNFKRKDDGYRCWVKMRVYRFFSDTIEGTVLRLFLCLKISFRYDDLCFTFTVTQSPLGLIISKSYVDEKNNLNGKFWFWMSCGWRGVVTDFVFFLAILSVQDLSDCINNFCQITHLWAWSSLLWLLNLRTGSGLNEDGQIKVKRCFPPSSNKTTKRTFSVFIHFSFALENVAWASKHQRTSTH